jgi:TonB family protein
MRPLRSLAPVLLALSVAVAGAAPLLAQEEPLAAGSEGTPVPKKTKHVQPTYPQEALAQGVRGIVILDIVVDTQGKVESTNVVRSVPGLDEAAIAAARQWEYEPTKVDGKPVRVRITVPITFALALPQLARQDGIPELRQGVSPAWPAGADGGGLAAAEVTLEPDGRVGGARVLDGEAPWSGALLAALRTWRFAPPPDDAVLSFRVEAEFVSGGGSAPRQRKVTLKAAGLQRSGLLDEPAPPTSAAAAAVTPAGVAAVPAVSPPAATAAPAPAPPVSAVPTTAEVPTPVAPPVAQPVPPATAQPVAPPDTPPVSRTAAPAPEKAPPAAPSPVVPAPVERPAPPVATEPVTAPTSTAPTAGATAAPPVEVITAPPPAATPENGVSAIRDVTLEPGVPDLTRGRRPVVPPLARMAGTSGSVEVSFSVSAAGTTSILAATGPDLLRPAAEQAVASWVFRRARADRAYLVAVFTSAGDKGTAVVRPQAPPPAAPSAAPAPTTPPATPDTPKAPPAPQP